MNAKWLMITAVLLVANSALSAAEWRSDNEDLAPQLAGRTAGEPVSCINSSSFRSTTVIPGVGIVYRGRGGKVYLNEPISGGKSLNQWDVLVTEVRGGAICRGEVVKSIDPSTRMLTGLLFLGDFVPYTRTRN